MVNILYTTGGCRPHSQPFLSAAVSQPLTRTGARSLSYWEWLDWVLGERRLQVGWDGGVQPRPVDPDWREAAGQAVWRLWSLPSEDARELQEHFGWSFPWHSRWRPVSWSHLTPNTNLVLTWPWECGRGWENSSQWCRSAQWRREWWRHSGTTVGGWLIWPRYETISILEMSESALQPIITNYVLILIMYRRMSNNYNLFLFRNDTLESAICYYLAFKTFFFLFWIPSGPCLLLVLYIYTRDSRDSSKELSSM